MYRSLSMYPKSADPALVDDVVRQTAAAFRQSPGCIAITTSVDALMGPGAHEGDYGRFVIVDFETLDDAMAALAADSFRGVIEATERLSPTHFLFECQEI